MRRPWDEAVRILRDLDGAEAMTKFQVGDLVLEQVPLSEDGVRNGGYEMLQRLANEAGLSFETLRQRRLVAFRIPPGRRLPGVSFSVYVLIANQSDAEERARLLEMVRDEPAPTKSGQWTVDTLRTRLGMRPTRYPPPNEESDASLARRLMASPQVADEVMSDITTRGRLSAAEHRIREREAKETERRIRTSPLAGTVRRLGEAEAAEKLLDIVSRTSAQLEEILPQIGGLSPFKRTLLTDILAKLDQHLDRVRYLATYGESDIDNFVSGVLKSTGE